MNDSRPSRPTLISITSRSQSPAHGSHRAKDTRKRDHLKLKRFRSWKFAIASIRALCILALLLITTSMGPHDSAVSAQSVIPSTDPNSVVPAAFRADKSWSEEGAWHWVSMSYDDSQRFTGPDYDYSVGKPLPVASYVATRVQTLGPSNPCTNCVLLSATEQGPPAIFGGVSNPTLASAYAHLDNGPRRKIAAANGAMRWSNGAWYLNYSPTSRTFFSWTWIPDDGGPGNTESASELSTSLMPSLNSFGQISLLQPMAPGSRVFPIAGQHVITQAYGCVARNSGYPSPGFCPPDLPSFHDGVDIAGPQGTPILAAASGTVRFAGIDSSNSSGNSIIVIELDGSNAGFDNVYMHWEKSYVKVGDHVDAGQIIAGEGSVGYSTGPHLHFSVRVTATNETIDPLGWLQGAVTFVNGSSEAEGAYTGVIRWKSLIDTAAKAHGVPSALIAAIMAVESSGNPNAVSPAGAQGLMQIMPDQLTRLGVPQNMWQDPAANIDAGARYLAESLGNSGTIQSAAARYFGDGCDALGTCTTEYVNRVLVLYVYFDAWFESGTAPMLAVDPFASTTTQNVPSTNAETTTPEPSTTTHTPTPTPTEPPATPIPSPTATAAAPANPSTTSVTGDQTATPSPTATEAATPSQTSTATPSPTATATESPSPTATATSTPDPTATPSPTATPNPTATATSTSTPTATATATTTVTATPIATAAATSTPTPTPQPTATSTSTDASGHGESAGESIGTCIIGPLVSELAPTPSGSTTDPGPVATGPSRPAGGCTPTTTTP
jgi:murein DD-endopeptidase MepM/ murein hydrolase activator NlpD